MAYELCHGTVPAPLENNHCCLQVVIEYLLFLWKKKELADSGKQLREPYLRIHKVLHFKNLHI
jgi:hypothetical protein